MRRDVPTCRLHEQLGDVAARVRAADWDLCPVLDEENVVLGLLDATALRGEASIPAERVAQSGPMTIWPHLMLDELGDRLKQREHVLVTMTDGRFLGVLMRSDVERKVAEHCARSLIGSR